MGAERWGWGLEQKATKTTKNRIAMKRQKTARKETNYEIQCLAVRSRGAGHLLFRAEPGHMEVMSSFRPSSRRADFVSSSFCFDTPPSGDTSTFTVSFRPRAEANLVSTLV